MSEKISRRVFLKATGLAALSVAAAGALGGCTGLSPLPGNVTLSAPGEYFDVPSATNKFSIAATALSDQWESMSIYEKDAKVHHYIYAGLYIKEPISKFELTTSQITCTIGDKGDKKVTVAGLGNIALNKEATYYELPSSVEVAGGTTKGFPLYLDLKDDSISSMPDQKIVITLKAYGQTVKITYATPSDIEPRIGQ